jgi:hypothetical protein
MKSTIQRRPESRAEQSYRYRTSTPLHLGIGGSRVFRVFALILTLVTLLVFRETLLIGISSSKQSATLDEKETYSEYYGSAVVKQEKDYSEHLLRRQERQQNRYIHHSKMDSTVDVASLRGQCSEAIDRLVERK